MGVQELNGDTDLQADLCGWQSDAEKTRARIVGPATRSIGRISVLLLLTLLPGCDDQEESGGDKGTSSGGPETSTASVAETSDDDCFAGDLGCACEPGDLCAAGLQCIGSTCEEPGGEDGTDDGTSGADDTGDGGVDACVENFECFESEICAFETCVPIADFDWQFNVIEFVPGGCRDGWGSAEIFYRYYEDGAQVAQSPDVGCPAQWPELTQTYAPGAVFELEFWELDFLFDDYFTRLCWPDPRDGICGPVPNSVLHEGGHFGVSSDGAHTFELYFEPVLLDR